MQIRQTKFFIPEAESRFWEALYILDYKFLLIPLCFFFLRIWACLQTLIQYYIGVQIPTTVDILLNYLAVSWLSLLWIEIVIPVIISPIRPTSLSLPLPPPLSISLSPFAILLPLSRTLVTPLKALLTPFSSSCSQRRFVRQFSTSTIGEKCAEEGKIRHLFHPRTVTPIQWSQKLWPPASLPNH